MIDDHSAGKAKVFLDDDNFLPQAIAQQKMKKLFDLVSPCHPLLLR